MKTVASDEWQVASDKQEGHSSLVPRHSSLPYPRLVCSNIAVLNPLETLGVLKDVATANVDLVQPDDETENYFRKKLGLPAKTVPGGRTRHAPIQERVLLSAGTARPPIGRSPTGPPRETPPVGAPGLEEKS